MSKLLNQRNGIILCLILAILFPIIFTSNQYALHVMTTGFIFVIAIYGMNILAGFTGQLSLAHAGFFAIGAYGVGILTTTVGFNFWLALPLTILLAVVIGFVIGAFALRTKEHFFAIYTLIVGYLIYIIIDKWDTLTGGVRGLIGIPVPSPLGPIEFNTGISMYYLVLFFLVLSIFVTVRIVRSLTGRTYIAIRNSEELAKTLGINTNVNKLISFVISVAFAALAGALFASLNRFIGPEVASTTMVFNFLMYMIVGGMGTLSGPIIGTLLFVWLEQFLHNFQEYRMLIFGPILTAMVIFYPGGIVSAFYEIKWKLNGKNRRIEAARLELASTETANKPREEL